jgi:hypothetical protein
MRPDECPMFQTCNASVCPVDDHWPSAAHLPGEKVCHYLLSSGKAGAAERYQGDAVYQLCLDRLPAVCGKYPEIGKRVAVASRSGFKGDNLGRKATAPAK